jgi:hypothetical protein
MQPAIDFGDERHRSANREQLQGTGRTESAQSWKTMRDGLRITYFSCAIPEPSLPFQSSRSNGLSTHAQANPPMLDLRLQARQRAGPLCEKGRNANERRSAIEG